MSDLDTLDWLSDLPPSEAYDESLMNDSLPEENPPVEDTRIVTEGGPTCVECGVEIPWAGRGRKPQRCDAHKRRTSARGTRPQKTSVRAGLKELESDLATHIGMLGLGLTLRFPVAGATVFKRSPNTAHALIKIAENNPKLMAILQTASTVAPSLELGKILGETVTAFAVDLEKVAPDAPLAQAFGVTQTYIDLHSTDEERTADREAYVRAEQAASQPSIFEVQVPPRFATVT